MKTNVYTSWILSSSGVINENKYYMLNTKDIAERKEYYIKVRLRGFIRNVTEISSKPHLKEDWRRKQDECHTVVLYNLLKYIYISTM